MKFYKLFILRSILFKMIKFLEVYSQHIQEFNNTILLKIKKKDNKQINFKLFY